MNKILTSFRTALPASLRSAAWFLKLMIPIAFGVTLLQHYGILAWLATYLHPIFAHLGLPGASAIAFMSGAAGGVYAGLAAMMALPLTMREATILAFMVAICHALPMECAVVRKTGSSFWLTMLLRIVMAFSCGFVAHALLPTNDLPYLYEGVPADSTLTEVLTLCALSQLKMSVMVILIIYGLMVIQHILQAYSLLDPLSRLMSPIMAIFGLPRKSAYMWLVGNVIGISYGAAVMIELEKRGIISREDANAVNYHLIMNHSMLEDTIVFAATGISGLLLIAVRITCAMIIVWSRKLLQRVMPTAMA